jgi:uncharacterized membrane protein
MLAKRIGAAAALALAALTVTTIAALADSRQTGSHSSHSVTLRACNHTDSIVLVASSFIPIGGSDWRNKGWTAVSAGQCLDIFKTMNYTFYARAEVKGDSDSSWGTDIDQCVEYPGPYDFYTKSEDTTCPEGEPAKFTTFKSDGSPVYVWNLNPPD